VPLHFSHFSWICSRLCTPATTGESYALRGLQRRRRKATRTPDSPLSPEGKAAPVPSAAIDIAKGQTFTGGKITPQGELASHLTPLSAQDAYDLERM